jgi:hypothetical protein
MEELFLNYGLSKILKDKGFDKPCYEYYGIDNHREYGYNKNTEPNFKRRDFTTAPTFDQALDFLREKNIFVEIQLDQTSTIKFHVQIVRYNEYCDFEEIHLPFEKLGLYRDYYEALNIAIEESLKHI